MYTRIIGDIHGDKYTLESLLNLPTEVSSVIQIGDIGIGFGQSDYWHESLNDSLITANGRFIRGNHDNPSMCKSMSSWIADGLVEHDVMYIGGAWSIDNPQASAGWHRRIEGVNWWADEQCSVDQFENFITIYASTKPRIMFTHDCPISVTHQLFKQRGLLPGNPAIVYPTYTGLALQAMYEIHQPDFWFFGHYHHTVHEKIGNTHFQCVGEHDYLDFNLATGEFRLL